MENKAELGESITIEYDGKTVNTRVWEDISDDDLKQVNEEFFKKPDILEVKKNFRQIDCGGTNSGTISRYYVRDLMCNTKLYCDRWCVNDILSDKKLLGHFFAMIHRNTDLYNPEDGITHNVERALQLGGAGFAHIPTNFPIQTVDGVLSRFNVNNNWYDMSCGWGNRLLGALKNKVNYFGTDPNYLLTERLDSMSKDWFSCRGKRSSVDIRTQGSEVFVSEWENKIGLCFTSPPYFYLEDYKVGNQSYKEGTSYEDWLNNFMKPTIQNCYRYLIDKGYLGINVKDFDKFNLCQDVQRIAEECGFELVERYELKQNARINPDGELGNSNEEVMMFMKKEFTRFYKGPVKKCELW